MPLAPVIPAFEMFGRLMTLSRLGKDKHGMRQWLCLCSCGKFITVGRQNLRSGSVRSCGCLQRELSALRTSALMRTHGHTCRDGKVKATPTYSTWNNMKLRCYYEKHRDFKHYGGRGIQVCDRWKNDFREFLADMGERPTGTTIDRIDVNGNYEPGNCRWATPKEQRANMRKKGMF